MALGAATCLVSAVLRQRWLSSDPSSRTAREEPSSGELEGSSLLQQASAPYLCVGQPLARVASLCGAARDWAGRSACGALGGH